MLHHHTSIRTADIHRAIAFYELLGFEVAERFTTGYTLACWMEGLGTRLELIQIPEPQPAPDAFGDEHYVGYYHLSFDVSDRATDLPTWLADLQARFRRSLDSSAKSPSELTILLAPHQQQIGETIYEVAFIADHDGLPLEFIRALPRLA